MKRCVVVGSGAREHALAWGLSAHADVVVTPGNAGMAAHGLFCTDIPATELEADLFVIGPELPLTQGLADDLRAQGKVVFGPGRGGAALENSKAMMKEFLAAADVPTAAFGVFSDVDVALAYVEQQRPPYVIKTDGLAAGKGVLVTHDLEAAREDIRQKLSGAAFGAAGRTIVIEEGLDGVECSLMVLCDGTRAYPLAAAQDYKRVGDGDTGPNTGGMGAVAPVTTLRAEDLTFVMERMIAPTLTELQRRGIDYRGVLFAGIMLTARGPQLLEYNVRFGDPETEALVPLYRDDLFRVLDEAARGTLVTAPRPTPGAAVSVIAATSGYPTSPVAGDVITGLDQTGQVGDDHVIVFHAGSQRDAEGNFRTSGGRVLAVTAVGENVREARERAYRAIDQISYNGQTLRRDIAQGHP